MTRKLKSIGPAIRAGQVVRIVRPDFFVRCGYPMDWATETARVKKERGAAIREFLKAEGIKPAYFPYADTPAFEKIAKALAHELCKQAGWGGKERTIHTKAFPDLAGEQSVIESVRFVKTGTYATSSANYDGEYDQPYLMDEKTHRILQTALEGIVDDPWFGEGVYMRLEIEAANVELV